MVEYEDEEKEIWNDEGKGGKERVETREVHRAGRGCIREKLTFIGEEESLRWKIRMKKKQ